MVFSTLRGDSMETYLYYCNNRLCVAVLGDPKIYARLGISVWNTDKDLQRNKKLARTIAAKRASSDDRYLAFTPEGDESFRLQILRRLVMKETTLNFAMPAAPEWLYAAVQYALLKLEFEYDIGKWAYALRRYRKLVRVHRMKPFFTVASTTIDGELYGALIDRNLRVIAAFDVLDKSIKATMVDVAIVLNMLAELDEVLSLNYVLAAHVKDTAPLGIAESYVKLIDNRTYKYRLKHLNDVLMAVRAVFAADESAAAV